MKRAMPWSDQDDDDSSDDDESSSSGTDTEANAGSAKRKSKNGNMAGQTSEEKSAEVKSGKKKSGGIDFEALKRHGYKGGLSVLSVPAPKEDEKRDWSWSNGKENAATREIEESYHERQKTRAKLADAELLTYVQTRKEKNNLSFSQKEKRKRELGQASRGKSYVEEEKRLLRESGIYSGFDA